MYSQQKLSAVNPLHPNNSIYTRHTGPYTFPGVLMRRICFTIQTRASLVGDHFLYSLHLNVFFLGMIF